MFLERLSVFDYEENKYYKPGGTFNVNSATSDIAIPNCTMYAYLRMHETCDCAKRQTTWIRQSGGFGNAKTWYDTTTLPKGSELRTGAIAVFNGNYGHVAFVERKLDSTHAIISESSYTNDKSSRDYHFFNVRKNLELIVGQSPMSGYGPLIGFIYPPVADARTKRDSSIRQIEIREEFVNVRKSAGGDITNKGCYVPMGIYNVKSTKEVDGFTWYELEKNYWVRSGDWLVDYEITLDYKALYEESQAKLEEIRTILK